MAGSGSRDSGFAARLAGFIFGAWMRLVFGLITIPVQAGVAWSSQRGEQETPTQEDPALSGSQLWAHYRDTLTNKGLELARETTVVGSSVLRDDRRFKEAVNDKLWQLLPLPVRMIGRQRLRWDPLLLGLRSQLFTVQGDTVCMRDDARERIQIALGQVFGQYKAP